jgi:SanA protein
MSIRMSVILLRTTALLALALLALALPRWVVSARYARAIDPPSQTPPQPIAIVFGAGLRRDGTPTTVLADRIRTAASLYHQGTVARLLLSGSDLDRFGDEAQAMRTLTLRLGVPDEAILVDTQGHRTYATCANARRDFGVRQAVLITQRYHLPRALAICEALGIHARGTPADLTTYSSRAMTFWKLREYPATLVALWETYLRPPANPPASSGLQALGCPDREDRGS